MALLQTGLAKSLAEDYTIDQSLRFADGDDAYLTRTPGSNGNRTQFTFSAWVKRAHMKGDEADGYETCIFSAGSSVGNRGHIRFYEDRLSAGYYNGSWVWDQNTTALYLDPGAWYHIVVSLDTVNQEGKMYVNGDEITAFENDTVPGSSLATAFNSTVEHQVGSRASTANGNFDGEIAEVYWIDGTIYTPSDFGETDTTTNQWKPIDASGLTFGTNGFYQKYAATELANSFTDSSMTGRSVNCDILIVGGGGGGGHLSSGGGGGAGGFVYYSQKSITGDTDHTVTIGAGGATASYTGVSGADSTFGALTTAGGGGGGGGSEGGRDGGSGGGSGAGAYSGGSATANQGFDGGDGGNPTNLGAGGGGGASAVGATGTCSGASCYAGTGGAGYTEGTSTVYDWTLANGTTATFDINGTSNVYAGGGGGGAGVSQLGGVGGAGGGGRGAKYTDAGAPAVVGTANTGGGGGGGGASGYPGAAGGSGVVIVRYDASEGTGTGGTVTSYTDGGTTYAVHTFTASGTFSMSGHTITANGDVANTRAVRKVGDSSILFDGTGDYLTIPDSTDWDFDGDFTIEMWFRADTIAQNGMLWSHKAYGAATDGTGQCQMYLYDDGNTVNWDVSSSGVYETTSFSNSGLSADTWYHIAFVRSFGNWYKIFLNGVLQTTNTTDTSFNISGEETTLSIGKYNNYDGYYYDGYLDEIRVSKGVARYTANFTAFGQDGGTISNPTPFTADSNTMLLIHSNWDGGLGADSSGNYNTFSVTNLVASDKMVDSPTNNFCTLNPLVGEVSTGPRMSYQTMSEGNLKTICNTTTDSASVSSTFGFTDGKWYYEAFDDSTGSIAQDYPHVGIIDVASVGVSPRQAGQSNTLGVVYARDGNKFIAGSETSYGDSFTTSDVIGMAIDADNGAVYFSKNGVWQNSGDPESGASRTGAAYTYTGGTVELTPAFVVFDTDMGWVANFGQDSSFAGNVTAQGNQDSNEIGDFYYEPPTDYLALCTSNLDAPSIKKPGENFSTVLWTGDASATRSITGLGFQADMMWSKNRSGSHQHNVVDTVRGVDNRLIMPNSSDAEDTSSVQGYFQSLDSDGWTMVYGSSTGWNVNKSGYDYVGWAWKGGGSAVTNTDGTNIDSQVSANTTAGFSICTYTGTGTNADSFGHGLSSAPELVIIKRRESSSWQVGSTPVGWTKYLVLDTAAAAATSSVRWNDTAPSASVVTLGTSTTVNASGGTYVAYCFHSVEGYSKCGSSYTGNGNADGTFVYTGGFRPAFIMTKSVDSTSDWQMFDDKRVGYNVDNYELEANDNAVEDTSTDFIDIVSNGFKNRITTDPNVAETYIYIAFASYPFKYSPAR